MGCFIKVRKQKTEAGEIRESENEDAQTFEDDTASEHGLCSPKTSGEPMSPASAAHFLGEVLPLLGLSPMRTRGLSAGQRHRIARETLMKTNEA